LKYLFAGGGTGGHIYPAIAIAKEILKNEKDAQILFVGTKKGLENELVPREGFELKTITVQGFKRKLSLDTLKTIYKAMVGLKEAYDILEEFKPDVVIGTGGYVGGPVLMMAALKGIRFVKVVAVSFEESVKYFKNKEKVVVTGNPIRKELLEITKEEGLKNLGFYPDNPLIVSFGGSRGAEKINSTMVEFLKLKDKNLQVLIITGTNQYEKVLEKVKTETINIDETVKVIPYCHNMQDVYAAADIIICRAGAITLAEITAKGVASILIPSPYVANNHQEYNARVLEKAGASYVILEKDLIAEKLYKKIKYLLDNPQVLSRMRDNARKISKIDAAEKIYKLIKSIT